MPERQNWATRAAQRVHIGIWRRPPAFAPVILFGLAMFLDPVCLDSILAREEHDETNNGHPKQNRKANMVCAHPLWALALLQKSVNLNEQSKDQERSRNRYPKEACLTFLSRLEPKQAEKSQPEKHRERVKDW